MRVITYQAPNGQTINLTEHYITELERAGTWSLVQRHMSLSEARISKQS